MPPAVVSYVTPKTAIPLTLVGAACYGAGLGLYYGHEVKGRIYPFQLRAELDEPMTKRQKLALALTFGGAAMCGIGTGQLLAIQLTQVPIPVP